MIEDVHFIDAVSPLAPRLAQFDRPWLGAYDPAEHELLISPAFRRGSIALIPLPRDNLAIGVMAFGSRDARRFTSDLAADFLAHLGKVVAISLENAVNRARLVRSGVTDFLTGCTTGATPQTHAQELARASAGKACLHDSCWITSRINDRFDNLRGRALKKSRRSAEARCGVHWRRFGGDECASSAGEKRTCRELAERIHQGVGPPDPGSGGAH